MHKRTTAMDTHPWFWLPNPPEKMMTYSRYSKFLKDRTFFTYDTKMQYLGKSNLTYMVCTFRETFSTLVLRYLALDRFSWDAHENLQKASTARE